jgi:hypothetical protein
MKTNYLINFKLFCSRRGFNLEKWIANTEDPTYELLCKMLVDLKVCPPSNDYFSSIADKLKPVVVKKDNEEKLVKLPVKASRKKKKKNEKDTV